MTLKQKEKITISKGSNDNLLPQQLEQTRRDVHEFLGLLGELVQEQADHTSPHYRKVIRTTLHTVPVLNSQLETLYQSLEQERLIHNDLYVQNNESET